MNKIINSLSNPIILGIVIAIMCTITVIIIDCTLKQSHSLDYELQKIDTKYKIVEVLKLHNCPEDISNNIANAILNVLTKKE